MDVYPLMRSGRVVSELMTYGNTERRARFVSLLQPLEVGRAVFYLGSTAPPDDEFTSMFHFNGLRLQNDFI